MGAMHRDVPGCEPALKASDLKCEPDFASYAAAHRGAGLVAARGAYARRRAWLAYRTGRTAADVDAELAPRVRALLADHPGGSTADAYCWLSKVAVASYACVGSVRLETPSARLTRKAVAIADKAAA